MTDKTNTTETEDELALPDFLDRASPEVRAIIEAGRLRSLEERKTELALATAPATVKCEPRSKPKPGSANAMAAKPKAKTPASKPAKIAKAASKVIAGKKSDAEMIKLIKEHRAAAGGTAGKTLKHLRGMGISCSQERFKKLFLAAS